MQRRYNWAFLYSVVFLASRRNFRSIEVWSGRHHCYHRPFETFVVIHRAFSESLYQLGEMRLNLPAQCSLQRRRRRRRRWSACEIWPRSSDRYSSSVCSNRRIRLEYSIRVMVLAAASYLVCVPTSSSLQSGCWGGETVQCIYTYRQFWSHWDEYNSFSLQ